MSKDLGSFFARGTLSGTPQRRHLQFALEVLQGAREVPDSYSIYDDIKMLYDSGVITLMTKEIGCTGVTVRDVVNGLRLAQGRIHLGALYGACKELETRGRRVNINRKIKDLWESGAIGLLADYLECEPREVEEAILFARWQHQRGL